jgi:hypothetical protein
MRNTHKYSTVSVQAVHTADLPLACNCLAENIACKLPKSHYHVAVNEMFVVETKSITLGAVFYRRYKKITKIIKGDTDSIESPLKYTIKKFGYLGKKSINFEKFVVFFLHTQLV